jgi:hypothetical protein
VEVKAGVQDPPAARIVISRVPGTTPFVETFHLTLFLQVAAGLLQMDGTASGSGQSDYDQPIEPNGTVAQAELDWKPGNQFAGEIRFHADTHSLVDGTYKGIESKETDGAAPLLLRLNATVMGLSADRSAGGIGDIDVDTDMRVFVNQEFDLYLNVFHNFTPREDWSFVRDGEYPVPP